jgi:hypothetical protein
VNATTREVEAEKGGVRVLIREVVLNDVVALATNQREVHPDAVNEDLDVSGVVRATLLVEMQARPLRPVQRVPLPVDLAPKNAVFARVHLDTL